MKYIQYIDSPNGIITLVANDAALIELEFGRRHAATEGNKITKLAAAQLAEYFSGARREFSIPLAPAGTKFQKSVWSGLLAIPYGKAISYKQLATNIGRPLACRAVGNANGKNPISIIIPCHRVIAADGTIGGYSSGLANKTRLLRIEGIDI
ncbi:MAG: methylated-DNA--[protein]-cysteine S-methyltransferase [Rickettsiales bacterium]|jgi:methylated-DNA-[protein]-cysteine S-methyltransferase|nr:methylated-DNA--[protein]-cysteine S-methyltransferase [Rickettsiales bacterium]